MQFEDFAGVKDLLQPRLADAGGGLDDAILFICRRIINLDLEHEPVQLRFGQRVGAFLLDGVLRGQNEKGIGQIEAASADGHLPFLHGFEQCGLRLGRRAVDFVGQDDVREDGAFDELQFAPTGGPVLFQDVCAGDVRRHQVRRELDAVEFERLNLSEGRNN